MREKRCVNCGSELPKKALFCNVCGTSVTGTEKTVAKISKNVLKYAKKGAIPTLIASVAIVALVLIINLCKPSNYIYYHSLFISTNKINVVITCVVFSVLLAAIAALSAFAIVYGNICHGGIYYVLLQKMNIHNN